MLYQGAAVRMELPSFWKEGWPLGRGGRWKRYIDYFTYHLPLRGLLLPEGGEFDAAWKPGCSASLPAWKPGCGTLPLKRIGESNFGIDT